MPLDRPLNEGSLDKLTILLCDALRSDPHQQQVRIQTAPDGTYKSTLDVFKKTFKADGFRGLYRGMATPLVGVTPIFAVSFWAYDLGKKIVYAATPGRSNQTLSIPELAFAGFFSAIPTTLLMSPSERIKVVLQVSNGGSRGISCP